MNQNQNESTNELTNEPTTTTNSLGDIYRWLKDGSIVMIYSDHKKIIFHDCNSNEVNKVNYIMVDVNKFPSLLDDGEWPDFLKEAGKKECTCDNILNKFNNKIKNKSSDFHMFAI